MKINTKSRKADRKSEVNQLRREGFVPAAVYVKGKPSMPIAVSRAEFDALLRAVEKGTLSTKVVTLADDSNKEVRALVKEIQYHPTSYEVLHIDFEELSDDCLVNVNVPIICTGMMECQGIKLGGVLRQVIRKLRIRCLPKNIPDKFELDVSSLGQKESKRLKDLSIPSTVRPMANLNEVAAVIVKR